MKIKVGACVLTSLGFIGLMTLSSCSEATEPSEQELALQSILNDVDERLGYVPIKPEPPASLLSGNTPEHILSPRDAVQHLDSAMTFLSITGDDSAAIDFLSSDPGCKENSDRQLKYSKGNYSDAAEERLLVLYNESTVSISKDYGYQSQENNLHHDLDYLYVVDASIEYPERTRLSIDTFETAEPMPSESHKFRFGFTVDTDGSVKWCVVTGAS